MRLWIDNRDENFIVTPRKKARLQETLMEVLRQEGVQTDTEVSVSFVTGEEIRRLNRDYRGVDRETDVLSFPVYEASEIPSRKAQHTLDILGDIVINQNRIQQQAKEYRHSQEREMLYLATHSLLHLLGYDHETAEERQLMRQREESVMNAVGTPQEKNGRSKGDIESSLREREGFEKSKERVENRQTNVVFHSGYVALIGRPNVGKSTLANQLMGQKLSIISNKPQTTRHKIQLIYTDTRMQVIFLDTPGVQIPKNELGETMLRISKDALEGVDLCLFVSDVSSHIGPLDRKIIEHLSQIQDTPILMLLNKIDAADADLVKAEQRRYEELGIFRDVLPISAKSQQNWDSLLDRIYQFLPEGPQYYPSDMITDRSERFLITEIIREKCLLHMQDEIPHGIHVGIDQMKLRPNGALYDIYATIYCEKPSHKGMLIGKGGTRLHQIGKEARKEIETLVDQHVNLKLWVKVDQNWRKKKSRVDRLGFD